jgi:hypothetical protein
MSAGKPDDRVGNVVTFKNADFRRGKPDGQRSDSVVQVLQLGRPDNGRRDFGFRQHPSFVRTVPMLNVRLGYRFPPAGALAMAMQWQ